MKTTVTLFLPGLLSNATTNIPSMPALSKLLSRSQRLEGGKTMEFALKLLFKGLDLGQIPSGALSALSYGLIAANDMRYWCRVDPVECLVDHQGAYVLGNAHLQLTQEEEVFLLELLNPLLQQDGITVQKINSEWLSVIPSNADVAMNDLLEVLQKNMTPLLPSGPDQTYWRRLLTECQMLLQSAPLNAQRFATQRPLISSVWFWGIGKLPKNIHSDFDFIYTQDSMIKGLSICANISAAPMPLMWNPEWIKGRNILFSDMQFYHSSKYQLEEMRGSLLTYYEKNWFAPLLEALNKGHIDILKLICADGRLFVLKRTHLKYFWKKIFPVEKFILEPVSL